MEGLGESAPRGLWKKAPPAFHTWRPQGPLSAAGFSETEPRSLPSQDWLFPGLKTEDAQSSDPPPSPDSLGVPWPSPTPRSSPTAGVSDSTPLPTPLSSPRKPPGKSKALLLWLRRHLHSICTLFPSKSQAFRRISQALRPFVPAVLAPSSQGTQGLVCVGGHRCGGLANGRGLGETPSLRQALSQTPNHQQSPESCPHPPA